MSPKMQIIIYIIKKNVFVLSKTEKEKKLHAGKRLLELCFSCSAHKVIKIIFH